MFDTVKEGAARMKYWRGPKRSATEKTYERTGGAKPGPKPTVPLFAQFLMLLIWLRLDLPQVVLADMFDTSTTTVGSICTTWLAYLYQTIVPALLFWPSSTLIRSRLPREFRKHFPNCETIFDATEVFTQKPGNTDTQYATYSSYKSHNTFKALISITPYGAFNYISDFFSGNVSDRFLTLNCGFMSCIKAGMQGLTDRGFTVEDEFLKKDAVLFKPPFTRKWNTRKGKGKRLNVAEIRLTRLIARLRIHVERAIQRIKCWRILQHIMPHNLKDSADMILKVIAALCNLMGALYSDKPQEKKVNRRKHVKRLQKPTVKAPVSKKGLLLLAKR